MKEKFSFTTFIRDYNQRIFFDILNDFEERIAIVWDRSLMKQLNVVGFKDFNKPISFAITFDI